jgi:hypothetical protein
MLDVCPVLVPKNGKLNQPSTVIPFARTGKAESLQDRKNASDPVLPADPVCVHADEPGWAVITPPVVA